MCTGVETSQGSTLSKIADIFGPISQRYRYQYFQNTQGRRTHVKALFGSIYAKGEISDRVDISNLSKLKLKLKVTQSLNIWLFSALKPTVTLSLISQMNNSLAESFIQIWHKQSSILLLRGVDFFREFVHSETSLEKNNITLFMTLGKLKLHRVQFFA